MKKYLARSCILLTCLLSTNHSWAQEWPKERPIRIIVPQAAGGTNDIVTRLIALELGKALGQSIIVENKPGASGAIGMQAAATATPDGYTFAVASDSIAIISATKESLSWRLGKDLIGVSLLGEQPIGIAVSGQTPYQTLQDLINAAKNKPDSLSYGTSGQGTNQHYIGEWLAKQGNFKWIHVPYKGGGQAIIDLTGGTTPAAVLGFAPLLAQQKKGGIRILAITSAQRNVSAPTVPTLSELGFKDIDYFSHCHLHFGAIFDLLEPFRNSRKCFGALLYGFRAFWAAFIVHGNLPFSGDRHVDLPLEGFA